MAPNPEINAKNQDKDPSSLRPFERYQVVKASWQGIVDVSVFNSVQTCLEENLQLERRRLASGQRRVFSLSGIIYCEDCGRPLVGSSGKGKKGVHRYYVHRSIRGEKATCAVRSLPAKDMEDAVFHHLDEVIGREGYLDGLEKCLEFVAKRDTTDQKSIEKQHRQDLEKIEQEILTTIRVASDLKADVGIGDMLKSTLGKLKDEKDKIERLLRDLVNSSADSCLSGAEARYVIELNLAEYRKARARAKASLVKRLIRRIFSAIVVGANGAKVSYGTTESRSITNRNRSSLAAPDDSSGAAGPSRFSKRRLMMIQEIKNPPRHPLISMDEKVLGGHIFQNGGPERIRTSDLRIRSATL